MIQSSDLLLSRQLIFREGVERHLGLVYTWSLCVFCRIGNTSDLLLLATKKGFKSDLELGLLHYHVKEINRYAVHFIHHKPITRLKISTGEISISSGKISYFTFGFIHGSLLVGLPAISVAMRVALAPSHLTITCHIAYNMLSHVCFLTFWEE